MKPQKNLGSIKDRSEPTMPVWLWVMIAALSGTVFGYTWAYMALNGGC